MSTQELKQKLSDYYTGKLDRQINDLREEIKYPRQPIDEQDIKVTSGYISNPTERIVISLMDSYPLLCLERRKGCIEIFLSKQTEEDNKLLEYTFRYELNSIQISMKLNISRATYYRKLNDLVYELGKYLAFEV